MLNVKTDVSSAYLVKQNILAVKNGYITAAAMRKYRKEHPTIHSVATNISSDNAREIGGDKVYGKKSYSESETAEDLVKARFTDFHNYGSDYPEVEGYFRPGYMPPPRPTRSSALKAKVVMERLSRSNKPEKYFVLKKFQNVPQRCGIPPVRRNLPSLGLQNLNLNSAEDRNLYSGSQSARAFRNSAKENSENERQERETYIRPPKNGERLVSLSRPTTAKITKTLSNITSNVVAAPLPVAPRRRPSSALR